jgi:O-antigen/teichoic acid export membrane protein
MNSKEVRAKVHDLLDKGNAKAEIFAQLAGQGAKDSRLAYFIASYPDLKRRNELGRKVNILMVIMLAQSLIGFLVGYGLGAETGQVTKWFLGILGALVPLLFAWGFFLPRVGAYNAYVMLAIVQIPRSFAGFQSSPIEVLIAVAMNVAVLAYVWYVRDKLFPDFRFLYPRRNNGKYVFSS